ELVQKLLLEPLLQLREDAFWIGGQRLCPRPPLMLESLESRPCFSRGILRDRDHSPLVADEVLLNLRPERTRQVPRIPGFCLPALLLRGSLRANVLLEVIGILGVPASQLGIRVLLAHRTVGIQQPLNGRLSISVLGREIQAMLTGIVEDRGV